MSHIFCSISLIVVMVINTFRFVSPGNCEGGKSFVDTPTPDIRARVGTNVQLTCLAYHEVVESLHTFVQWTFNGKEVDDSRRINKIEEYYGDMGNFTLSIVNVTGTDEGLYTCKVYFTDIGNKLPAVRINVTVEGKLFNI